MKRWIAVLTALLILGFMVSCKSKEMQDIKEVSETKPVVESQDSSSKNEKPKAKAEEEPSKEPEEEKEKVEVKPSVNRTIQFQAFDYLGQSHQATITDPEELAAIDKALSDAQPNTGDIMPYLGAGFGLYITENGTATEYYFGSIALPAKDGSLEEHETAVALAKSGVDDKGILFPKEVFEKMQKTYSTDEYRFSPPESYEIHLVYNNVESTEKTDPESGVDEPASIRQLGDTEVTEQALIDRIKAALKSSEAAAKEELNPYKKGGQFIQILVRESRSYKEYTLTTDSQGMAVIQLSSVFSDTTNESPDSNWYVCNDPSLYDDLVSMIGSK